MNLVNGSALPGPQLIKKQEDIEDRAVGKDAKPIKTTLNRVPRSSCPFFAVALLTDFTLGACVGITIPNLFSYTLTSLPGRMRAENKRCDARGLRTLPVKDVANSLSSVSSKSLIAKPP
jgi:hypothetical protein